MILVYTMFVHNYLFPTQKTSKLILPKIIRQNSCTPTDSNKFHHIGNKCIKFHDCLLWCLLTSTVICLLSYSVKKCIAQTGNKIGVLQQKHLVQLDWAPTEDGSHVLTVAVGSKILFFSPVSNDLAVTSDLINNG